MIFTISRGLLVVPFVVGFYMIMTRGAPNTMRNSSMAITTPAMSPPLEEVDIGRLPTGMVREHKDHYNFTIEEHAILHA